MAWAMVLLGVVLGVLLADACRRRRWRPRPGPGRRLACHDVSGAGAELTVSSDRDHVLLRTPGGEALLFEPLQVGPLRAALRDAATPPLSGEPPRPHAWRGTR